MDLCTNCIILFLARTLLSCVVSLEFIPFGSHEYYIASSRHVRSYREADILCENENASLVVIDTTEVQDFLEKKVSKFFGSTFQCFYIGLVRNGINTKSFLWSDGTNFEDDFLNWAPGQPNNNQRSENCVTACFWDLSPQVNSPFYIDIPCDINANLFICFRPRKGPLHATKRIKEALLKWIEDPSIFTNMKKCEEG